MKKIKVLLGILMVSIGVSSMAETTVGIANPASEFCVKQGGKTEIVKDKDGNEMGKCKLKNGKTVDEWEYYRENNFNETEKTEKMKKKDDKMKKKTTKKSGKMQKKMQK